LRIASFGEVARRYLQSRGLESAAQKRHRLGYAPSHSALKEHLAAKGIAVVDMVEAILLDKHKIVPCSVYLQGEYGVRDLFVGVPCRLGARGLEKIIEIKLTPDEDAAFKKSAGAVKELVEVIKV